MATLILPFHTSKMTAVYVIDFVMPSKPLIQIRIVCEQQISNRSIFPNLTLKKQLRLPDHRLPQRVIKSGKQPDVRIVGFNVTHLQPLANEIVQEPRCPWIG